MFLLRSKSICDTYNKFNGVCSSLDLYTILGGILPDQPVTWTLEADSEIDMDDIHFLSSTARSCLQTPLIKLRCLCDHPQVGAYGVR